MERIRWYGPSIVLFVTVLGVMFAGPSVIKKMAYAQEDANIQLVRQELKANPLLDELSNAYAEVAEAVERSVVHIEVSSKSMSQIRDRFFGQPGPSPSSPGLERYNPPALAGNGAGWIYDDKGHIITNNHVVQGGEVIKVRFFDGAVREAKVVGADPRTDIAVLRVDADQLHPAAISQTRTRKGEIVFAFGSPFKFEFSMSQGIVSAHSRRLGITGLGGYENFIQTDAEINPGNSGGPLVNIYGEVVGMNTAIASRNGQFQGLGFAIPVKLVQQVADELIDDGKVQRGYLGVYIDELTPTMGQTFGYEGEGVLVNTPIDGSPAAEAGVRSGDIIVRVESQAIDSPDALRLLVAGFKPGRTITLGVFRDGKTIDIDVKLARLPDDRLAAGPGFTPAPPQQADPIVSESLGRLGIEAYETFSDQMASDLGLKKIDGVILKQVRRGSTAAVEGLQPGTVITRVMSDPVTTAEDLEIALAEADLTQPVRFTIAEWNNRGQEFIRRFVVVKFPAE